MARLTSCQRIIIVKKKYNEIRSVTVKNVFRGISVSRVNIYKAIAKNTDIGTVKNASKSGRPKTNTSDENVSTRSKSCNKKP